MHHTRIIDVMACGAAGDGSTLDTAAVNRAIETCASKGGGQVFFPPGHYLSGTVVLRSHVSLRLEAGARLMGAPDLSLYQSYSAPAGTPEAKSPEWHRALVLGVNVEDVSSMLAKSVLNRHPPSSRPTWIPGLSPHGDSMPGMPRISVWKMSA